MKIIQFTTGLVAGGAERMAVNIANSLSDKGHEVMLISLTGGGDLEQFVSPKIKLVKLERKYYFDLLLLKQLYNVVKKFKPQIVHSHLAAGYWISFIHPLLKNVKVVFHDHYGDSEFLENRKVERRVLKVLKKQIDGVITCNTTLKNWWQHTIGFDPNKIIFLNNYPDLVSQSDWKDSLPGYKSNRVVLLANFRPQKAHEFFLSIANELIHKRKRDVHFLLIGGYNDNTYYQAICNKIDQLKLNQHVHILGVRNDIKEILENSKMGILTSKSEGLPVALLEYGLAGLPVVCTDVGQCNEVCNDIVPCIPYGDTNEFAVRVEKLLDDEHYSNQAGELFHKRVLDKYSMESFINSLIAFYTSL